MERRKKNIFLFSLSSINFAIGYFCGCVRRNVSRVSLPELEYTLTSHNYLLKILFLGLEWHLLSINIFSLTMYIPTSVMYTQVWVVMQFS